MRARGGNAFEIPVVGRVFQRHHLGQLLVVLFLKHLGVLAIALARLVIAAVLADGINEEPRQHLDALRKQGLLFLEVGFDGLADLDTAQCGFADIACRFPRHQLMPIGEAHGVGQGIDVGHHEAPVLLQATRQIEQVVVA